MPSSPDPDAAAPDGPVPDVSVVVATHGRAEMLSELLDSLVLQEGPSFEIVVVDDDSRDRTPEVLASRAVVRSFRVSRSGPGRARQHGWQRARGRVIAFTDDDCVAAPGWLAALTEPLLAGRADLAQGRTLPRPDQEHLRGPWSRTQKITFEKGYYQTCNMAYRREVLEATGGFAPHLSGPLTAGEDTDLAWRAKKGGYRSCFVDEAVVHHAIWPGSWREAARGARRRQMVVQVVRDHPELREHMYRRYFYQRYHARLLAAAAGLVLAGRIRRWLPAALVVSTAAAYLIHTSDRGDPARARLEHLAQVTLVQALEVRAFVAASIRHRTVLL